MSKIVNEAILIGNQLLHEFAVEKIGSRRKINPP